MWNIETNTEEKTFIYWCKHCEVPVIRTDKQVKICPICNKRLKKLTTDIRPVFPAERALIEMLTDKEGQLMNASVWKGKIAYYVNGETLKLPNKVIVDADTNILKKKLKSQKYNFKVFNRSIELFIKANSEHLAEITKEAHTYIRNEANNFSESDMMISFSGGKDSTVTADLVVQALKGKRIKHIFGDTTLEHDLTYEYIERLKKNKEIEIITARNNDNDFYKMAEKIGPPSRMSRWSMQWKHRRMFVM